MLNQQLNQSGRLNKANLVKYKDSFLSLVNAEVEAASRLEETDAALEEITSNIRNNTENIAEKDTVMK